MTGEYCHRSTFRKTLREMLFMIIRFVSKVFKFLDFIFKNYSHIINCDNIFQMMMKLQHLEQLWMISTSESYFSTNLSHKSFVVITYQLQNIGNYIATYLQQKSFYLLSSTYYFQFYKFFTIISVRTISTIFELFFPIYRITSTNT